MCVTEPFDSIHQFLLSQNTHHNCSGFSVFGRSKERPKLSTRIYFSCVSSSEVLIWFTIVRDVPWKDLKVKNGNAHPSISIL